MLEPVREAERPLHARQIDAIEPGEERLVERFLCVDVARVDSESHMRRERDVRAAHALNRPCPTRRIEVGGDDVEGLVIYEVALLAKAIPHCAAADANPRYDLVRDPRKLDNGTAGLGEIETQVRREGHAVEAVSYTHLRAHETRHDLVCR